MTYRMILLISFIRKKTDPLITILIIASLSFVVYLTARHIINLNEKVDGLELRIDYFTQEAEIWKVVDQRNQELIGDVAYLKDEIENFKLVNAELVKRNDELEPIFDELEIVIRDLEGQVDELVSENTTLISTLVDLDSQNEDLLNKWLTQAQARPQPPANFKITFYSTSATYSHLIPRKTVAMNSQQVADLGLRRGDEIYVVSNKGWSGFYRITDSGCAYGTIDIYVNQGDIPSYGVEYNVGILF